MADFQDIEESQSDKWLEMFKNNGISLKKAFPWEYYPSDVDELKQLSKDEPKKAICKLFFLAVSSIVKENPIDFVTREELNAEFNDLFNQALYYGISIPI